MDRNSHHRTATLALSTVSRQSANLREGATSTATVRSQSEMPKDKNLTCFFWHHGHCKNADNECWCVFDRRQ